MKLAEALQERADINRKIEQLKVRLNNNVLVQDGEKTAEDPIELKKQLDACILRLEYLMERINYTNCNTLVDGESLTKLISRRDALTLKIKIYKDIAQTASQTVERARYSEIKILSTISASDIQKQVDDLSKQLRIVDNHLQENNWKTDLIEN